MNLKKYLHNYGQNILNTNHKLAAKLNRILSDPKKRENKRLHALIQDIKTEILGTKDDINIKSRDFITIDGFPEINLPLERPLSYPEIKKVYETPIKESADITDFAKLFSFHALEREEVYKGIKDKLEEEDRAYLSDIVKDIPVKHGLEEILTYYDIASSDPKCTIVKNEKIIITYIVKSIEKKIELPEIIFCS
ncbi:MAG: hypothetical protein B6229_10775 [Spirochaetaceae bacterium 4572_7]|nr:MAG: hypothetical protein B6229_10775 [Spirochaetaceae bacterium 4572_7]